MVTPSTKKSTSSPPTSYSYLLLAVKILLVVVIILLLPKLVTGANNKPGKRNKKLVRELDSLRFDCERTTCKEYLPEENSMCVSHCVSKLCHEEVYGANPLEDGEVDISRARDFQKCVKDELRAQRARDRAQQTS